LYFDIHSHILPSVDDGAKDMEDSLTLLKMMKKNGIDAVLATSHFYPEQTNYDVYIEQTKYAFEQLKKKTKGKKLPEIYLGCEMLYYKGIGNSDMLAPLCLNGSRFLLLELTDYNINEDLFEDILNLKENQKIIPIIAHAERYYKARNYKKFLGFLRENYIPVQINAASVMTRPYKKGAKTILKSEMFCVIATDTHSKEERPPLLNEAYGYIKEKYSEDLCAALLQNSEFMREKIIGENVEK